MRTAATGRSRPTRVQAQHHAHALTSRHEGRLFGSHRGKLMNVGTSGIGGFLLIFELLLDIDLEDADLV